MKMSPSLDQKAISKLEAQEKRKKQKPLMEKKRRERINKSLIVLKDYVLVAQNKDVSILVIFFDE